MSRSERSPPVCLKIVDAYLKLCPVGHSQVIEVGDHQASAMGGDELGAFLGRLQFFIALVARSTGISRVNEVRLRPAMSSGCSSCT